MDNRIQDKILESINESITRSVTTSVISSLLPDNAWLVLAQFGTYKLGESPRAFTTSELKRLLRGIIHINTIRSMLWRLEEKALIRVISRQAGQTKTGYRYIITGDGMKIWGNYQEEMKNNIGKVEI